MKKIIKFQAIVLVVAIIGTTLAAPQVPILVRSEIRDDHNQFAYSFSSGNGHSATAQGALKPNSAGTDNVLVQQGSYAFLGDDGILYELSYIADENGFQPIASYLPTPPPPPPAVEAIVV